MGPRQDIVLTKLKVKRESDLLCLINCEYSDDVDDDGDDDFVGVGGN